MEQPEDGKSLPSFSGKARVSTVAERDVTLRGNRGMYAAHMSISYNISSPAFVTTVHGIRCIFELTASICTTLILHQIDVRVNTEPISASTATPPIPIRCNNQVHSLK